MQSFQEQDYTKRFDLSLWRKLIKVAKPYHKNLIAVVLFMAVSAIIDVIMPNMNAYAIDVFIANHSTAGLVGFVVAYALLTAYKKGFNYRYVGEKTRQGKRANHICCKRGRMLHLGKY